MGTHWPYHLSFSSAMASMGQELPDGRMRSSVETKCSSPGFRNESFCVMLETRVRDPEPPPTVEVQSMVSHTNGELYSQYLESF